MTAVLRALATWPWRLVPRRLRIDLIKAGLYATRTRPPREALGDLLEIDRVVSGQIDLAAMAYGDGVHVKHRLMRYHDFFVARIARGERVLDVGCGYGAVAASIAERAGARVTGIDTNATSVSQARARFRHPSLHFVHGEAPGDLPPGSYDVVVLSNVLEHIQHRQAFLEAIVGRATPGRLLIRVPMRDRHWHVPLREELGLFAFSDPTHFTEYTRDSFAEEMAAAKLSIRHVQVNWGEIWAEVTPRA